ncbi:MAG: Anaerobic magnesium-protoporphyrin IX monomethyl ester cyclase [Myxococcota bacterium]|nr:Anaerobic magnesium-protoporphyrin IX monomethyl ester cyclase [Myxococcota bacterium]
MRVLLINLPYRKRLQRRFVASYFAPNFLIPPLELMQLGAIAREWKQADVLLLDCIAEGLNIAEAIRRASLFDPDILVTMTGFNSFPEEVQDWDRLCRALPRALPVMSGYLPTQFPREVLERTQTRVVLLNEPELSFAAVMDRLARGQSFDGIDGAAFRRDNGEIVKPREPGRIAALDELPFPDHGLVKLDLYNESFLPAPIGVILSERGCPYACNYCVRYYGRKLVGRSAEHLLEEIDQLVTRHGVRGVRFMDDTFTIHRERLMKVCQALIDHDYGVYWSALTRLDHVDPEVLALMRRSGCRRLYVGIESGDEEVRQAYQKGLSRDTIVRGVRAIREAGIEISGFFIVGDANETEEQLDRSIAFAQELELDYIIATKLQYWPGTPNFEANKDKVGFDLFTPGRLLYEPMSGDEFIRRQRKFLKKFYLRPSYMWRRRRKLLETPRDMITGFGELLQFVSGAGANPRDDFI